MLSVFEDQWREIMEDGQMSESARIRLASGSAVSVSGIFFSGTYSIEKAVPYSPKNGVDQQFFQVSELSLDKAGIEDPDDLKMAGLQIDGRGSFRVTIVKGKGSGMITLQLQPRRDE